MTDGETLYNKIIDVWEEAESYTKEDVIDIISDIGESIKNRGQWLGSDTIKYIQSLKIENMQCPICNSRLDVKASKGYLAEAWGMPIEEDYSDLYCPECDWHD